jgi:hypothetical protein
MGRAKRCIHWTGVAIVIYVSAGCGSRKGDGERSADTRFDENQALFGAIRDADRLVLYEGLPHQFFEAHLVEEEKQRKETVTLHGYPFYSEPLDVTADDAVKLKGLLADERLFLKWRGEKKCGGFHPDYLAEWRVGEAAYRFLVCFGCCEVKVYSPDRSLRCDIQDEAYKQLQELLKRYRKNRPASREP